MQISFQQIFSIWNNLYELVLKQKLSDIDVQVV